MAHVCIVGLANSSAIGRDQSYLNHLPLVRQAFPFHRTISPQNLGVDQRFPGLPVLERNRYFL